MTRSEKQHCTASLIFQLNIQDIGGLLWASWAHISRRVIFIHPHLKLRTTCSARVVTSPTASLPLTRQGSNIWGSLLFLTMIYLVTPHRHAQDKRSPAARSAAGVGVFDKGLTHAIY